MPVQKNPRQGLCVFRVSAVYESDLLGCDSAALASSAVPTASLRISRNDSVRATGF